jgi:hypothetical protein
LSDTGTAQCLLSNSIPGDGIAMLQARVAGKSWAEIADQFGLKGPSAARSQFTKLTGIKDYKIKGKDLQSLWDQGLLDQLKAGTPKKVKAVVDEVIEASDPIVAAVPQPAAMPPDAASFASQTAPPKKYVDTYYEKFKGDKQLIAHEELDALDTYKNVPFSAQDEIYLKFKQGKTLSQLGSEYGLPISDVDKLTYYKSLVDNQGDVWKTYVNKVTSKTGFEKVKLSVQQLKTAGFTEQEILDALGIDPDVLKLINAGKWTEAKPGATSYVKHDVTAHTFTPSTFTPNYQSSTPFAKTTYGDMTSNYKLHSESEWLDWTKTYGNDLSQDELRAVGRYTGSEYRSINGALRADSGTTSTQTYIENLDRVFRPVPEDTVVYRNVSKNAFAGFDLDETMIGKVYNDKAFMSTSINGAFGDSREIRMVINLPAGSNARYVDPISSVKGEKEVILPRNSKFMVTGVSQEGPYSWRVVVKMLAN